MTIEINIEDIDKVDVLGVLTERCKQHNLANGMTEEQWNKMMGITTQEAPDDK